MVLIKIERISFGETDEEYKWLKGGLLSRAGASIYFGNFLYN